MAEEGHIDVVHKIMGSSSGMIDPQNGKYYAKNGIVSTWALIYFKSTSTPGQRRSGASETSSEGKEINSSKIFGP